MRPKLISQQNCKAAIERLGNALDKFKRQRDVEIRKWRSFRRLAQNKAKAQRSTWRTKHRNQFNTNRSEAAILKEKRRELEQQMMSLKMSLREVELLKVDLSNIIAGNKANINRGNGYPTHDAAISQRQYLVIPSSAIQQISQPTNSRSVRPSFGQDYPTISMPSAVPSKSQKPGRKASVMKREQNHR